MRQPLAPTRSSLRYKENKRCKLNGHLLLEYLLELRESGYDIRDLDCTANFRHEEMGAAPLMVSDEEWKEALFRYDRDMLEYRLYQEANTNEVGVRL